MVFDGLGPVMAGVGDQSGRRQMFERAYANARGQLDRHRETGDDVLVSRYEQLLAYFSERARLWRA